MSAEPSTPRVPVCEWVQTFLLCANLGWTTLCLGGVLAETKVVAASLTIGLLIAYAFARLVAPARTRPRWQGLVFVPFIIYAAANVAFVTPVRWLGWIDWYGSAQTIAVFWIALDSIRSRPCRVALYATLFALGVTEVVLAAYQQFVNHEWLMLGRTQVSQYAGRASGSFGIPNSMAALLLLLLPLAGALACRRGASIYARILFGWLSAVLLLGLGLTVSRGAGLGLTLALAIWPCLWGRWNWRRRSLLAAAVLLGAAAVLATLFTTSDVVRGRALQLAHDKGERSRPILWRAAWAMTREHPWFGTGAASFNVEFERYRPDGFLNEPIRAHNDYLNTLSDYGAVGALLLFGPIVYLVRRGRRRDAVSDLNAAATASRLRAWLRPGAFEDPLVRQAQAIGLLAFALQLFVDFHLEIPALALSCAIVGALVLGATEQGAAVVGNEGARSALTPERAIGRWAVTAGAVGLALAFAGLLPLLRGEALRESARRRIDALALHPADAATDQSRIAQARLQLARAVRLAPSNGQAWSDEAYALAQWSRFEPGEQRALGNAAERDADRALVLAPVLPEFWVRRGVARDMQDRWEDAGADFTAALQRGPRLPLTWYHYAYHLSLRNFGLNLANEMVATCLRLDPANAEALRLRQQLATGRSQP